MHWLSVQDVSAGWFPVRRYKLDQSYVMLLSEITGFPMSDISKVIIVQKSLFRPFPFYAVQKGGGAITFAGRHFCHIYMTENYFTSETSSRDHFYHWTRLLCHELMHQQHGIRFKSIGYYLWRFALEYLRYGHDKAPLEQEAERYTEAFDRFYLGLRSKGQWEPLRALMSETEESHEKCRQTAHLLKSNAH